MNNMDLIPVIEKLKKHHYFYLIIVWYFCLGDYTNYIVSTIDNHRLITAMLMMLPIILVYTGNDDGVILLFLGILLSIIPHAPFINNLLMHFLLSAICCLFIDLWLYAIMKTFWINTLITIADKYIKLWNMLDFAFMCAIYLTITYFIINVISSYLSQYQTITTIPTIVKILLENKESIGLSIVLSRVYNHKTFLARID